MESRRRVAAFFAEFRQKITAEASDDPEPAPRFSPEWEAWLVRDLGRQQRRTELAESEALTTVPEDVCPVGSMGHVAFLAWAHQQEQRRRARSPRRRTA